MSPAAPTKLYKKSDPSSAEPELCSEQNAPECFDSLNSTSDEQTTTSDEDEHDCPGKVDQEVPELVDLAQLQKPEATAKSCSTAVGVDSVDSRAFQVSVTGATDEDTTDSHACHDDLDATTDHDIELESKSIRAQIVDKVSRETQTERSPVSIEALDICLDVVDMALNKDRDVKLWETWKPRSASSATMFQLVNEILDGHSIVYKSMVDKLELVTKRNFWSVKSMCDEVFSGGDVSWGRIVAVYAVCVQLARSCRQQSEPEDVAYSMADTIGHYVGSMVDNWIMQKGGWGALVKEFPPKDDMQKKIWKTLLVTGLSLGMFATVIKAIR